MWPKTPTNIAWGAMIWSCVVFFLASVFSVLKTVKLEMYFDWSACLYAFYCTKTTMYVEVHREEIVSACGSLNVNFLNLKHIFQLFVFFLLCCFIIWYLHFLRRYIFYHNPNSFLRLIRLNGKDKPQRVRDVKLIRRNVFPVKMNFKNFVMRERERAFTLLWLHHFIENFSSFCFPFAHPCSHTLFVSEMQYNFFWTSNRRAATTHTHTHTIL